MKYSTSIISNSIQKFLNSGHKRTVDAKKNIVWLFGVRGLHIVINMALVPIAIQYINPVQYGVWLTLSSIMGWFAFFDIGLSNGLRNKFAEAKARGDLELARSYVSTTYAALFFIFSFLWLLFVIVNRFIDWTIILNAPEDTESEFHSVSGTESQQEASDPVDIESCENQLQPVRQEEVSDDDPTPAD